MEDNDNGIICNIFISNAFNTGNWFVWLLAQYIYITETLACWLVDNNAAVAEFGTLTFTAFATYEEIILFSHFITMITRSRQYKQ